MLKEYRPASEYDLKKYYPDLYLKVRELRRNHALGFLRDNLERGIREGLYRKEMDTDMISRLGVSLIDSIVDSEIITIDEFLNPHFFSEFFEYHLRGISNEKGLALLEVQLSSHAFSMNIDLRKEAHAKQHENDTNSPII
jgi:hypothetical protein